MQSVENDTLGIVIHVHGKYYPPKSQREALGAISPRAIIEIKERQKDVMAALPFPRQGRVYALQWLYLVNTQRGSAKVKRERIMQFVDEIRAGGGEIFEVGSGRTTKDTVQRRAMLSDAFEAVARRRMSSMSHVRGRPTKKVSAEVWAKAEAIWNNRKLRTWADTQEPLKALGLTPAEAWRKFGARE